MILGSGLIQASGWPKASDWLIRDEFTDTRAAGSVPGTAATPGPGTRAASAANVTVGSGYLEATGVASYGDASMYHSTAITRAAGVALLESTRFVSSVPSAGFLGWRTDADLGFAGHNNVGFLLNSALCARYGSSAGSPVILSLAADTDYKLCSILKSAGRVLLAYSGGAWKLLWVDSTDSTATMYAGGLVAYTNGVAVRLNSQRVIQLPAPFDTDDGLATDTKSGSVAAGTTFSHEGNHILEYPVTVPSADNVDVAIRMQDDNNHWFCRVDSTGAISLYEVVSGSPTQRSTAAGVVSTGHRVVIIADGTTIKGYSNNTLRWTYSSATNFATATAGKVLALGTGGAVSDLKTWPRTLSGTAATILNKVSA